MVAHVLQKQHNGTVFPTFSFHDEAHFDPWSLGAAVLAVLAAVD